MDPVLRDTWRLVRRHALATEPTSLLRSDLDRIEEALEGADQLEQDLLETQTELAQSDEARGELEKENTDLAGERDEYLARAETAEEALKALEAGDG